MPKSKKPPKPKKYKKPKKIKATGGVSATVRNASPNEGGSRSIRAIENAIQRVANAPGFVRAQLDATKQFQIERSQIRVLTVARKGLDVPALVAAINRATAIGNTIKQIILPARLEGTDYPALRKYKKVYA